MTPLLRGWPIITVGDKVVLPEGTEVLGQVTAAAPSGRVKGLARLAFDFDRVRLKGKEHPIEARAIDITADNTHKKDAAIVGGGTAGGAMIGALAGGKRGAGISALVERCGGNVVVLTNRRKGSRNPLRGAARREADARGDPELRARSSSTSCRDRGLATRPWPLRRGFRLHWPASGGGGEAPPLAPRRKALKLLAPVYVVLAAGIEPALWRF